MTTATTTPRLLNGIDTNALRQLIANVASDADRSDAGFEVTTRWQGGTVSATRVEAWKFAGNRIAKDFTITIDEPCELGGTNTMPNPQEYLMAALNACMMVGYVAVAALHGVELESVEIQTEGELNLRGFLGIDPSVPPGYPSLHYTVRIKGDGTVEQLRKIHETVMATSPNYWNISQPVKLTSDLVVQ